MHTYVQGEVGVGGEVAEGFVLVLPRFISSSLSTREEKIMSENV